jgi:integrase
MAGTWGDTMRSRHQNGWLELTAAKTWKCHWHCYVKDAETGKDKRINHSQIVGTKAKMAKYEAKAELDKIVAGLNSTGPTKNDDRVTLEWFWTNRFLPMREGAWRPPTLAGYKTDWKHYLAPRFGDTPLRDIDAFACQKHISGLAKKTVIDENGDELEVAGFCESVVKRTRTMLSSIMELAVELDFIAKNPAKKIKLPDCKATPKPTLEKQEIVSLIAAVKDTRDQLILLIGTFCALTSSELFGLRWDCYQGEHLIIRNTAYHGVVYERVKRKARERNVPLAPVMQEKLEVWRMLSKDTAAEALIFPGLKGGALWPGVWLKKRIQCHAVALGITTPVTFQVLRRSCATRNQKNGTLKDVQAHLGHSNIATTGNVYMQAIPESVREMVAADVQDVMRTKVRKARRSDSRLVQ